MAVATTERVLPAVWVLTAAELERICGKRVDPRAVNASRGGRPELVDDVEGMCRGAIADAQRRGLLAPDIERGDWLEVLGFLLGEVIVHAKKYDPDRRGIEFRPWLYERIRVFAVVEASRWLYGRRGQHRVPDRRIVEQCLSDLGVEGHAGASFDHDGFTGRNRLDAASVEDSADRVDARRWVDATSDRGEDADAGVAGGGARGRAAVGDRRAGARAGGRAAPGAGRTPHWLDCLTCGWRNFPQAPNGVDRWHFLPCAACGADLQEQAA